MNESSEKSVQGADEGHQWKLPALMSLALPLSVSTLCIMSTILKHDWILCAVSFCGPLAMAVGVYLTLKSISSAKKEPGVTETSHDQAYRSLLVLSCVYFVTYLFFYGAVQLLMRAGQSGGGL
jgi:hypothetical protein